MFIARDEGCLVLSRYAWKKGSLDRWKDIFVYDKARPRMQGLVAELDGFCYVQSGDDEAAVVLDVSSKNTPRKCLRKRAFGELLSGIPTYLCVLRFHPPQRPSSRFAHRDYHRRISIPERAAIEEMVELLERRGA